MVTSLIYFVLAVPLGRLADRVGRARVFVAGYLALVLVYGMLLLPTVGVFELGVALALFGAYYAAPVLEFYPKCSVTNWLAQPSTPEEPQPGWADNRGRIHMPPLVTAWNPTAYGAASWVWKAR